MKSLRKGAFILAYMITLLLISINIARIDATPKHHNKYDKSDSSELFDSGKKDSASYEQQNDDNYETQEASESQESESHVGSKDDQKAKGRGIILKAHQAAKEVLHEKAQITSSAIMTGVHIAAKVTGAARRIASQILDKAHIKNIINIFDNTKETSKPTAIMNIGPNIEGAKKYVYLSGAAYCPDLERWDCVHCESAKLLGYSFYDQIFNSKANTFGFISLNHDDKEIIVTFRGTMNLANAVQDVSIRLLNIEGDKDRKIRVPDGFLFAVNSLYPQVIQHLTNLTLAYPDYSVVITGHSLGGAMASITLYMLLKRIGTPPDFPEPPGIELVSFGQPRSGNKAYADFLNSQENIKITRVIHLGDIAAHFPPAKLGAFHHGVELWLTLSEPDGIECSKEVYEDPTCSNSLGPIYTFLDHLYYWDVAYHYQGWLICRPPHFLPGQWQKTAEMAEMAEMAEKR